MGLRGRWLVVVLAWGCSSTVSSSDAGGGGDAAAVADTGARPDVAADTSPAPTCECPTGRCPVGATWRAGDGCNTCSCMADGLAGCTLIGCLPPDAGPPPVDVAPTERVCASNADCGPGQVCEFEPGCAVTRGRCHSDDCHSLPVAPQYCGCDGMTLQQVSACLPDRPWRSMGGCTNASSDAGR